MFDVGSLKLKFVLQSRGLTWKFEAGNWNLTLKHTVKDWSLKFGVLVL